MIPFAWSNYSRRMRSSILNPLHVGKIDRVQGRLVTGEVEGQLCIGLDVNTENGLIDKARFTCFGPTLLVAVAEALCTFIEGKTLSQAARLTDALIERELCDPKSNYTFSPEERIFFELVHIALASCLEKCTDIAPQVSTPIRQIESQSEVVDFDGLTNLQKIEQIEAILDEHIRPYIELDAGGLKVKELNGLSLLITYEGACTSCPASVGGTLNAITQVLRKYIHPSLQVEPDSVSLEGI